MANILNSLFREPRGYFISTDPDPAKGMGQQAVKERDSISCRHCNKIVLVPPRCPPNEMPYALCWGCRGNICLQCDDERARTLKCVTIEQKLDEWEAKGRFRRELEG